MKTLATLKKVYARDVIPSVGERGERGGQNLQEWENGGNFRGIFRRSQGILKPGKRIKFDDWNFCTKLVFYFYEFLFCNTVFAEINAPGA